MLALAALLSVGSVTEEADRFDPAGETGLHAGEVAVYEYENAGGLSAEVTLTVEGSAPIEGREGRARPAIEVVANVTTDEGASVEDILFVDQVERQLVQEGIPPAQDELGHVFYVAETQSWEGYPWPNRTLSLAEDGSRGVRSIFWCILTQYERGSTEDRGECVGVPLSFQREGETLRFSAEEGIRAVEEGNLTGRFQLGGSFFPEYAEVRLGSQLLYELRLVEHRDGDLDEPLRWKQGPSYPVTLTPGEPLEAWDEGVPATRGAGLVYPLEDAFQAALTEPRFLAFVHQNPHGYIVSASYAQDEEALPGAGYGVWFLSWGDPEGDESLTVRVIGAGESTTGRPVAGVATYWDEEKRSVPAKAELPDRHRPLPAVLDDGLRTLDIPLDRAAIEWNVQDDPGRGLGVDATVWRVADEDRLATVVEFSSSTGQTIGFSRI